MPYLAAGLFRDPLRMKSLQPAGAAERHARRATLRAILLLGSVLAGLSVAEAAGIYRSIDNEGNVVFTDRPTDGAESVAASVKKSTDPSEVEPEQAAKNQAKRRKPRPSPLSVAPDGPAAAMGEVALTPEPEVPLPQAVPPELDEPEARPPVYRVQILNPGNGATLFDPVGKFWVELQSYPTPVDQSGLTAELWMDGKLVASGDRPTLGIPAPASGSHQLWVRLVDDRQRPVLYSQRVSINIRER